MRRAVDAPETLDPAVLLDQGKLLVGVEHESVEEGHSLNEPVVVPSMLAPLSPQM